MIGTETKLWKTLSAAAEESQVYTRIETSTATGVADVEYVASPWHGWIELKTCEVLRETSRLTLESPYTLAQLGWLLTHHDPAHHLRSWLLVGFRGARTWREWWLLSPRASAALVHVRKAPSVQEMRSRKGIVRAATAQDVVKAVATAPRAFPWM